MKKILIFGGTTFVSSALAKYLISKGYPVDILTRGLKPADYTGFGRHIVCDRKKPDEIAKVLKNSEYEYIFDISAYTKQDIEIIFQYINTASLKKYIFCSSGAVYKPAHLLISEDFDRGENPHWGKYGTDKLEAEDFLFEMHKTHGFPVVIFRPPYIYGENNNLYREVYFFDRIASGKPVPVPFGNEILTQFIYIDDLVKVFESAMTGGLEGKAYNVAMDEPVSWELLVKCCGEAAGCRAEIKKVDVTVEPSEVRSYFPFRDVYYMLDVSGVLRDNLYTPSTGLSKGLKRTYQWYAKVKPALSDPRMSRVDQV